MVERQIISIFPGDPLRSTDQLKWSDRYHTASAEEVARTAKRSVLAVEWGQHFLSMRFIELPTGRVYRSLRPNHSMGCLGGSSGIIEPTVLGGFASLLPVYGLLPFYAAQEPLNLGDFALIHEIAIVRFPFGHFVGHRRQHDPFDLVAVLSLP